MKTVLYFYESAFMMWRRRLAGIFAVARKEGWHVEPVDVGELEDGPESVVKYWKPDGLIVDGGVFRHKGCTASLFRNQIVVYCDVDGALVGKDYFGVWHNPEAVVKRALRELSGRELRDYGYVHYRTRCKWTLQRATLFLQEVAKLGKKGRVFDSWERTPGEDGAAFVGTRLGRFLESLSKPCGILAANDEMAVHVLRAAQQVNIAVPEELVVMGVDNDELLCENTLPTLSSVAPAFERSGKLAAGLLARRFRNPDLAPVVLEFGSSPVERRHSTRKTELVDMRAVRAVEYVRVNACNGISVADVVREMGLKTRTAENRFRQVAKRSIRDEILAVRIETAKKLLLDPKTIVNSIYERCGYGDPRSLRYVFTKATGLSPAAWRAKHL